MTRLTFKDALATLFTLAAVLVYVLWATETAFIDTGTRTIALAVFALGFAGCMSNERSMTSMYAAGADRTVSMTYVVTSTLIGFVALVAGLAAMLTGTEAMVATLVVATVALWILSTVRHMMTSPMPTAQPAAVAPDLHNVD